MLPDEPVTRTEMLAMEQRQERMEVMLNTLYAALIVPVAGEEYSLLHRIAVITQRIEGDIRAAQTVVFVGKAISSAAAIIAALAVASTVAAKMWAAP